MESFLSVFRLYQAGFENVVALMGSSLSERQEELIIEILEPFGKIILLFDADKSGQVCAQDCLARLSTKFFVKVINISQFGRKPHQLTPEQQHPFFKYHHFPASHPQAMDENYFR